MAAQKVKIKDGNVFVDKKEYLTYKGDAFYTYDGVRLFSVTRKIEEYSDNNMSSADQISTRSRTLTSNPQLVVSRSNNTVRKVRYYLVKFALFDLEFETSLNAKKVIKGFYNAELINEKGLVDESKAWNFAKLTHKNISGTREKLKQ